MGRVHFDIQPQFPCFALFLDSSNSLVLKPTGNAEDEYVRIGIAKFLRTRKQQEIKPLDIKKTSGPQRVPWGPITDTHARAFVKII
jgi:hypothetical protein